MPFGTVRVEGGRIRTVELESDLQAINRAMQESPPAQSKPSPHHREVMQLRAVERAVNSLSIGDEPETASA